MKNILILSHLSLSESTNVGKTLLNLFDGYPKEKLTQLYFKKTDYDIKYCNSSYYIGDIDVFRSIFKHSYQPGMIGVKEGNNKEKINNNSNNEKNGTFFVKDKRSAMSLLLRDFVWWLGHWNNEKLDNWINMYKPEVIFLAPGYSSFAYRIALKLAQKYNIPLFVFFMEDFYNERFLNFSFFYWLRYIIFRWTVRNTVKYSSGIFAINEALSSQYEKDFERNVVTIFNPFTGKNIKNDESVQNRKNKNTISILYAGSIGNDRFEVLKTLIDNIHKFNMTNNKIKLKLELVGVVKDKYMEEFFEKSDAVHYGGLVNSDQLKILYQKTDVLLHVESFNPKYIAKTRLALSTKIAEYLTANKLIMAVGPCTIESISYLSRNNAAIIIDDLAYVNHGISTMVRKLSDNSSLDCIKNAKALALTNHLKKKVQEKLYKVLNSK